MKRGCIADRRLWLEAWSRLHWQVLCLCKEQDISHKMSVWLRTSCNVILYRHTHNIDTDNL